MWSWLVGNSFRESSKFEKKTKSEKRGTIFERRKRQNKEATFFLVSHLFFSTKTNYDWLLFSIANIVCSGSGRLVGTISYWCPVFLRWNHMVCLLLNAILQTWQWRTSRKWIRFRCSRQVSFRVKVFLHSEQVKGRRACEDDGFWPGIIKKHG